MIERGEGDLVVVVLNFFILGFFGFEICCFKCSVEGFEDFFFLVISEEFSVGCLLFVVFMLIKFCFCCWYELEFG